MSKIVQFHHEDYPEIKLQVELEYKYFRVLKKITHKGEPLQKDKLSSAYLLQHGENVLRVKVTNSPAGAILTIDGKNYDLLPKPRAIEYLIGAIPLILMIWGGVLGITLGFIAWYTNMNFLRFDKTPTKYLKVLAMTLLIIVLWYVIIELTI